MSPVVAFLFLAVGGWLVHWADQTQNETEGNYSPETPDLSEARNKVKVIGEEGERRATTRRASSVPSTLIRVDHKEPKKVERNTQPLWQVKGWRKKNGRYIGPYEVNGRSYRGEAEKKTFSFKFYIYNLPQSVKAGGHGACFKQRGKNKHWIHFYRKPKSLSSGILAVESTLKQSLN